MTSPKPSKVSKGVTTPAQQNSYVMALSDFLAFLGCDPSEQWVSVEVVGTPGSEQLVVETVGT